MKEELQNTRMDYIQSQLDLESTAEKPLEQFAKWLEEYKQVAQRDYNAMVLSTANASGKPSSRIVLLKGISESGLEFFTNYESAKGREMAQNPLVALNFFWPELERQIRVEGWVEKLPASESDLYFKSRPIGSQIGAIASPQSEIIEGRTIIEQKVKVLEKLPEKEIRRPAHWGGYRVIPNMYEFWQGRSSRLHDRIQYVRNGAEWHKQRLAP